MRGAMYAARHAVFVGPGKLPGELRDVLHRRAGAPQPDIAIQVPRLLALFDSAAEAERVASQLQRLKLGAMVAGPEQPPIETTWAVARSLEFFDGRWRVATEQAETLTLDPAGITAVTQVDWRPVDGPADRALLLTVTDGRPVLLRASRLDEVSRQSVPLEGMRRLTEFLEAAALQLAPELRVRTRRLSEADFQPELLTGDLLPLLVGMVDAVDTHPGELPRPLGGGRTSRETVAAVDGSDLGRTAAWLLYLSSLAGLVASLALLGLGSLAVNLTAAVLGVALGAWGTRRFMWARWAAKANWAEPPVPSWPIHPSEPGIHPRWLELALDAVTLAALAFGATQEGALRWLSLGALPVAGAGALAALAAAWDAHQRD